MRSLLERFAEFVIAKLSRLVTEYTLVRRDETMESWTETTTSRALAWALVKVLRAFDDFPWLIAKPKNDRVHEEFERIVSFLRAPITLDGAQPT